MENIDKILESIVGLQKAAPPPYLASKVMAKLNTERPSVFERILSKPSVVMAFVVILISLNLYAFNNYHTQSSDGITEDTVTVNDFENNFAINYFNYSENEK